MSDFETEPKDTYVKLCDRLSLPCGYGIGDPHLEYKMVGYNLPPPGCGRTAGPPRITHVLCPLNESTGWVDTGHGAVSAGPRVK